MNFESLDRYLDEMPSRGIPGCDLRVWQAHKPIYERRVGVGRPGQPMTGDETYWFYSASKVICMAASMQLIERGIIALDDPVSRYLPAYASLTVRDGDHVRPAKTVLTLRHLMSMQGGLNYNLNTPSIQATLERYGASATTRQIADALAAEPLDFDPGTHFQYSLCHDVMAAVIEAASGMTYGEYLQKNLFDPLGAKGLTFHPDEAIRSRLAARYFWDEHEVAQPMENQSMDFCFSERYESGGAGLCGDAASYLRIADAIANDGVGLTGARILRRETIDLWRTPQLTGASKADFDALGRTGYSYALGVRVLTDASTSRGPAGEFGWDSAAAAWVMLDPDHHLCALFTPHVLGCGRAYVEYHPAMRDLIYEGMAR